MSIYQDPPLKPVYGFFFLLIAALIVIFPPFIGVRELFGREVEFAAAAQEMTFSFPWFVVHGELIPFRYPLFPLLAKGIMAFGFSPEWALRILSAFSLLVMTSLTYNTARIAYRSHTAGAVSAAVCLTVLFSLDRVLHGYPDFMGFAFIYGAWLILFSAGLAQNAWPRAWFYAGVCLTGALFTIGPSAFILFGVPLIFQARPFSGWTRMRKFSGIACFASVALLWGIWSLCIPVELPVYDSGIPLLQPKLFSWEGFRHLFEVPFDVLIRLLPWSLLMFLAFCPACTPLDRNAFFTRFVRILFISVLVLLVIVPFFQVSVEGKLLIPLLGILVSTHYPLFARRHGARFLKLIFFIALLSVCLGAFSAAAYFVLPQWVPLVLNAPENTWLFAVFQRIQADWIPMTELYKFAGTLRVLMILVVLISLMLVTPIRRYLPLWTQLTLLCCVFALYNHAFSWPHRALEFEKRDVAAVLIQTVEAIGTTADSPLILYREKNAPRMVPEWVYLREAFPPECAPQIRVVSGPDQIPVKPGERVFYIAQDVPPVVASLRWQEKEWFRIPYNNTRLFLWEGVGIDPNEHKVNPDVMIPGGLLP